MKSPMERRLDLGLKQRDVAKVAHVACSSVSRLERGVSPMHQSTKIPILRALEALETEQLTKMCAEDGKPVREKAKPFPNAWVDEHRNEKGGRVYVDAPAPSAPSCPPCHGTGIVWSPAGQPWKCPYCGGNK